MQACSAKSWEYDFSWFTWQIWQGVSAWSPDSPESSTKARHRSTCWFAFSIPLDKYEECHRMLCAGYEAESSKCDWIGQKERCEYRRISQGGLRTCPRNASCCRWRALAPLGPKAMVFILGNEAFSETSQPETRSQHEEIRFKVKVPNPRWAQHKAIKLAWKCSRIRRIIIRQKQPWAQLALQSLPTRSWTQSTPSSIELRHMINVY